MTSRVTRATATVVASAWLTPGVHGNQQYAFDAAGRAARVDQRWELRKDDGARIDLMTALARCGSQIFMSDSQSRVYRLDATAPSATLHVFAGEDQGISRPAALAADCDRDRLYVVNMGPRTVVTLNNASGAVIGAKPFKRELYEARSATLVGDLLYIGGLWNADTAHGLPSRDTATFFESTWLGEKLSLTDGGVEGALPPYETRCPASGACTYADIDRVRGAGSAAWVAEHGMSTRIALYDARGSRMATYDVTSPKFLRDGTEIPVATPAEATERWKGRNSVMRRVYALADCLVAVHTRTSIGPDWHFGEPSQFLVFMNILGLDGSPLVSDVGLADLPIGRDESNLYAVDYGAGGRRNGVEHATLLRVPVRRGADAIE